MITYLNKPYNFKMIALGCLWFLFVALLASSTSNQAVALTVKENLDFIDKILELLNNQEECIMPTFEEVDDLSLSFKELEESLGSAFESELSEDQKILKNTLLDQWESFQKRTFGVVILSAKKRSFRCKVESYQKEKFGTSICSSTNAIPNPKPDISYERNSIVRYIKHLETRESPKRSPMIEIHLTPISWRVGSGSKFSQREKIRRESDSESWINTSGRESQKGSEEHNRDENYDPLVDIPDVSVRDSSDAESEYSDTASGVGSDPFVRLEASVTGIAFVSDEQDSQGDVDHSPAKLDVSSPADPAGELGNESSVGANYAAGASQSAGFGSATNGRDEPTPTNGQEEPISSNVQGDDGSALAGAASGASDDIAATKPANMPTTNRKGKELLESEDIIYLDDATDDKHLRRLTKVKPMLLEFGITYKGFRWPDESTAEEFNFDDTVKTDWNRFLNDPYLFIGGATLDRLWAVGPEIEVRNSISDRIRMTVQPPPLQQSGTKESGKSRRKRPLRKLASSANELWKKITCRSVGNLFSFKVQSENKMRLMKMRSDL